MPAAVGAAPTLNWMIAINAPLQAFSVQGLGLNTPLHTCITECRQRSVSPRAGVGQNVGLARRPCSSLCYFEGLQAWVCLWCLWAVFKVESLLFLQTQRCKTLGTAVVGRLRNFLDRLQLSIQFPPCLSSALSELA